MKIFAFLDCYFGRLFVSILLMWLTTRRTAEITMVRQVLMTNRGLIPESKGSRTGMKRPTLAQVQDTLLAVQEYCERLEAAIRKHRDEKGDHRCWLADGELYAVLGEGDGDDSLPPRREFLENCARYYDKRCRAEGLRIEARAGNRESA